VTNFGLRRTSPTLLSKRSGSVVRRQNSFSGTRQHCFVLRNLPAILLVLALILSPTFRGRESLLASILSWVLLFPIGVTGISAAISHPFFPQVAAADIG
jgi:hypothetical protein